MRGRQNPFTIIFLALPGAVLCFPPDNGFLGLNHAPRGRVQNWSGRFLSILQASVKRQLCGFIYFRGKVDYRIIGFTFPLSLGWQRSFLPKTRFTAALERKGARGTHLPQPLSFICSLIKNVPVSSGSEWGETSTCVLNRVCCASGQRQINRKAGSARELCKSGTHPGAPHN